MNWIEEVEKAFGLAACRIFSLDPSSKKANDFIRRAYRSNPEGSTNSPTPANKDVMYIYVSHGVSPNRPLIEYDKRPKGLEKVWRDEYLKVLVTFYGQNADVFAARFRTLILQDGGVDTPYDIMRRNHIAIQEPISEPISMPEIIDGSWRRRADVQLSAVVWHCEDTEFNWISEDAGVEITMQTGIIPNEGYENETDTPSGGNVSGDNTEGEDSPIVYPSVLIDLDYKLRKE